jgi:hypothetical protein
MTGTEHEEWLKDREAQQKAEEDAMRQRAEERIEIAQRLLKRDERGMHKPRTESNDEEDDDDDEDEAADAKTA